MTDATKEFLLKNLGDVIDLMMEPDFDRDEVSDRVERSLQLIEATDATEVT